MSTIDQYQKVRSYNANELSQLHPNWECNICLDNVFLHDSQKPAFLGHQDTQSKVHHVFHANCLNEWLAKKSSCPTCREPLMSANVRVENTEQALIQLEIHFPGAFQSFRQYAQGCLKALPISLSLATTLVVLRALKWGYPLLSSTNILTGAVVGSLASSFARYAFRERTTQASNLPEYLSETIKSKSFLAGLATVGALGAMSSLGSILIGFVPEVIEGVLVHYAVDKLKERQIINQEQKEVLQTVSNIATSTFALINPVRSTLSLMVGAVIGGVLEARYAVMKEGQTPQAA